MKIFVGKVFYPHDNRSCYWSREGCYIGVFECESLEILAKNVLAQAGGLLKKGAKLSLSFSVENENRNPTGLYHREYFPLSQKEIKKFFESLEKEKASK